MGLSFAHLYALIVGAVGLALPEEGEEPPHGHLVVEDALAGVEAAVRHLGSGVGAGLGAGQAGPAAYVERAIEKINVLGCNDALRVLS